MIQKGAQERPIYGQNYVFFLQFATQVHKTQLCHSVLPQMKNAIPDGTIFSVKNVKLFQVLCRVSRSEE